MLQVIPKKVVRELLTRDMNRFQRMLNVRLIDRCANAFAEHRRAEHATIQTQLKTIPRHARAKWLAEAGVAVDRRTPENAAARGLYDFLVRQTEKLLAELQQLRSRNAVFRNTIAKTQIPQQRRQIILDYAQDLSGGRGVARGDVKATARSLNEDAMNDRFVRVAGETEQRLAFVLERLGKLTGRIVEIVGSSGCPSTATVDGATSDSESGWRVDALRGLWGRLRLERVVQQALVYDGDPRVRLAAMKCFSFALAALPPFITCELLSQATLAFFQATALDRSLDVWMQCEALSLLQHIIPRDLPDVLYRRFATPTEGDDMFVRRHAVTLIATSFMNQPVPVHETPLNTAFSKVLFIAVMDPSEFVRQQVGVAASYAPADAALICLEQLITQETCPRVRAATLVALLEHARERELQWKLLEFIHQVIANDSDEFVVRTALLASTQWLERFAGQHDPQRVRRFYGDVVLPILVAVESKSQTANPLRRWSAQARERIWLNLTPTARSLYDRLCDRVQAVAPGKSARIPRSWLTDIDLDFVGRVMGVMAQDDFGYDLDRDWIGYRLVRGPVFRFRFWRFWYELRHRATDKRQAFQHTIGRVSDATIRAPSQIMGELSQTKVPGEPFLIATDGSWRPFLPLVDDFISAVHCNWFRRRPIRFFTSQGITEVIAPRSLVAKLRAACRLTFRFEYFARLRNWDDDPQSKPTAYLQAMESLGFSVRLRAHTNSLTSSVIDKPAEKTQDESVRQFFPCLALAALSPAEPWKWLVDYANYFGSVYENTLIHLVVFVVIMFILFSIRHWVANLALRRARRRIPLSIGGWGTRGKSGTERLKAALIGAMGHGLVSKTTGCEAMFIQAHAYGEPLEIPLFRPYDKATIWEQSNILKLAAKLRPSVFLWECMGLTPAYVDVLSRQWTCDDLATITNTYPDHEDLQGPAGHNVANTIAGFVPRRSHLITTEQEMRPIVAHSCQRVGTTLRGVGWLQSGLITDDLLDRFPYKEHPDNIALVAAMGDELGVSYEFSVKAMADFLVPDLGVLKVYPIADVRKRRIEFTNGMSANERFGCLGNWKRLGYAQSDPYQSPTTWITGVVNNRADRVPRSRVFANIMVHDISVDRFFLIGNNLKGLMGFVEEAWAERAEKLSLLGEQGEWDTATALEQLAAAAKELRQPICSEHVQAALHEMIAACVGDDGVEVKALVNAWKDPDQLSSLLGPRAASEELASAVRRHHEWYLRAIDEYEQLVQAIEKSSAADAELLNKRFRDQLKVWFDRKLVLIDNYDATGEEVIRTVVEESPPGFLNRMMGLQNIKGTGLDFVYRFQAWDTCYNACQQLLDDNVRVAEKGLQTLAAMPVLGQLCEKKVKETIAVARQADQLQRTAIQTELSNIEKKIQVPTSSEEIPEDTQCSNRSPIVNWLTDVAEQYFDVHDAVRRRHNADRIYRDLHHGRISRQHAVEELRKINKRQKGGWLASEWFGN